MRVTLRGMTSHLAWLRKAIAALAVAGALGGTQIATAPWAAAASSGKHHHHGKHHGQSKGKGKHHKHHNGGGKGKHTTTTT